MDIEFLKTGIVEYVQTHQAYAPLVIGLMTFAESLAFISLLLPTTAILITVGFVLAAAEVPFWQIWAGAACGAFLGNWVSYAIGRRYKKAAYQTWPLSRSPKLIERGESFFQRFGPWAVFIGRFIGPVRAVIALIAGIFLMPPVLFQAVNMASASAWAFLILGPGASLVPHLPW